MRSRTSRGVPEWSGGKDLYMGSHHTVTGNIRGYTGIVPGPPEGFRGSTGRVHLPQRALWAVGGREPALSGLGANPPRCWKYALEAIINGYYYISLFMVIVYYSCYNCIVRKS